MRLTASRTPVPDETCDPASAYPHGFVHPDPALTDAAQEGRLADDLRSSLREHAGDPVALLARAALVFHAGDRARGHALADLAVTGERMFDAFRTRRPRDEDVLAIARRTNHDAALSSAVSQVLDRAYHVAWAIRGLAERAPLAWIAVSGEDDPPHRPVNTPATRYRQYDLDVDVHATAHARARTVRTRFAIARSHADLAPPMGVSAGIATRTPPPDLAPVIGSNERLIVFVHGHSSQVEEFEDLAPKLVEQGFSVIAMDLPCNGYASMFDHTEIADDRHTDTLEVFPILDFIEQFIVDFIHALELRVGHGLREQIAAVIGGSLGGNMGLRLAQRDPVSHPYLANIVSWSAASVWNPFVGLTIETGPNTARARMQEDPPPHPSAATIVPREAASRRAAYFTQVFEESASVVGVHPQPTYWYRDGWPCKAAHIEGARVGRREIYNRHFRRWHWRVALEQMLFSHRHDDRYKRIRSRVLSLAGAADDAAWTHIYDATKDLDTLMINTPGSRLLLETTGHSIHNERPAYLARAVHDFLPPWHPNDHVHEHWSGWHSLGGRLTSRPAIGINEDGRIEVFARGTDHRIWHTSQLTPGGSFSGWAPLQGGLSHDDVLGESIAVGVNHDGRLEVYAQLARNQWIAHVWQDAPDGTWHAWDKGNGLAQLIGGAEDAVCVESRVGDAPVELTTEDGLRFGVPRRYQLVAARRTNGAIHIRGQNAFGWWTNGRDLGRHSPAFTGTPAMARNLDGRLELFARDHSGRPYHIWETSSDHWVDDWAPLGATELTGDMAVERTADGRLEVFARGSDGALWHTWQVTPNSGWSPWGSLGGTLAVGAVPAVAKNGWNELEVFVRWTDGSIRSRRLRHDGGFAWTEWTSLGGVATYDPVVAANPNGTLVVFHVGRDGAVYANVQGTAWNLIITRLPLDPHIAKLGLAPPP